MTAVSIPLHKRDGTVRAHALVDAEDEALIAPHRWRMTNWGYAITGTPAKGTDRLMHRLLLGLPHGDPRQADHLNRNRLDNRRANLRVVTSAQNAQNTSAKGGTSAHRGVAWRADTNRWEAYAHLNGCKHSFGCHLLEEDAAEAAQAGRLVLMPYSVEAEEVEVELPYTTGSVNVLGTGRALSRGAAIGQQREKKRLQADLEAVLMASDLPQGVAPVEASACLVFRTRGRRDIDNYRAGLSKALGDALVNGGWLADDTPEHFRFTGVTFECDPARAPLTIVHLRWWRDPAPGLPSLRAA